MHHATDAPPGAITPEGELLSAVYGRLVRWHYIIAAAAAKASPDAQATMMREMMATMKEIEKNPEFRAASEARHAARERESSPPTPEDEARIARLRARAAVGLDAKHGRGR